MRYTNKSTASARYKRAGAAVKSRQARAPSAVATGLTVAEKAQYGARVVLMFATRTTEGGQRDGSHSRLAPPDDVGRPAQEDLRLPHRPARPLQRQEDGALRRQGADLPPLLRKPPRRCEHDPDDLPVPPGGRDGPARLEPDQDAQPRPCRPTRSASGPTGFGERHRLRGRCERLRDPSDCTSRTRAGSSTRSSARPARTPREPYGGNGVSAEHAIRGATASRSRSATRRRWTSSSRAASTATRSAPRAPPSSTRSATAGHGQVARARARARRARRHLEASARARSTTSPTTSSTPTRQQQLKDWLEGLGYTDCSEIARTGSTSIRVYVRSPSGALFELRLLSPEGFEIDEDFENLGAEFQVPPQFADQRDEISRCSSRSTRERSRGSGVVGARAAGAPLRTADGGRS